MNFNEQLKESQSAINSYVKSVVYNPRDAEDVIQNVNLILLEKKDQLQEGKPLKPWAFSIARFQIKKFLKQEKRWNKKFVNFTHEDFPLIEDPFHDITKDEKTKLDLSLKRILSKRQYEIYSLLLKGYTNKDITRKLCIQARCLSRSKHEMLKKAKKFIKKRYK